MSDANGSTNTPRKCTSYSKRSVGGRVRAVVYLRDDLAEYAIRFCDSAHQSFSSLVNDLIEHLRDEV